MIATVKELFITLLSFSTSHYISGWRPITKTFHLITFLLTDVGIVGVGEGTPYGTDILEDYAKALSLAKVIKELTLKEALDALKKEECEEFKRKNVNYGAYLSLESAVLNALFQHKLMKYEAEVLGSIYRAKIPLTYTIFLSHPRKMARRLEEAIEAGFKHVKFKIPRSLDELERLIKALGVVRRSNVFDDVVLRMDANGCFSSLEKAEEALSIMERYNVDVVEQPMPRGNLKDIARLRRKFYSSIEVMLDESLRKPSDIELFAQIEAADAVNFHPSKLGCLTITREAILKTQKLGMKANIGSALMTEVGLSHYLNLAASIPKLDYPLEEIGICNLYGYSITREPPEVIKGHMTLRSIMVTDLDFNVMRNFLIEGGALFKERLRMLMGGVYRKINSSLWSDN